MSGSQFLYVTICSLLHSIIALHLHLHMMFLSHFFIRSIMIREDDLKSYTWICHKINQIMTLKNCDPYILDHFFQKKCYLCTLIPHYMER